MAMELNQMQQKSLMTEENHLQRLANFQTEHENQISQLNILDEMQEFVS